jgi:LVIVD repeat-containing protein
VRRVLAIAVALSALCVAPAAADQGPDYISSDNVQFVKSLKLAADGVGARIVGKYMYVTSTKDLEVYDISTPENPQMVGSVNVNVEFENEEVPTNGTLLGISGQTPTINSAGVCPSTYPLSSSGCLAIYDVRDKAAPKLLTNVTGAGDHTSACVLDCSYFYGSAGSVTDARTVLANPASATRIGNWQQSATIPDYNPNSSSKFVSGCHHVQEIRPGILLAACQPILLLSVRPEDGGSILAPKVLGTGVNKDGRFIHGVHWPRAGADKFMIAGGEKNFQPSCDLPDIGAIMTWDASHVNVDGSFSGPLDEWRPTNGAYLDSNPPLNQLGCSAHWFEEHATFKDGGLIAEAAYENGTRFLQITSDGKIHEQGFFVPLGGSTSAPHWAPTGDVVYAIDYERGIDVLKYSGRHYVPGADEPDRKPGTFDLGLTQAAGAGTCKSGSGFKTAAVRPTATGHGHSHAEPSPALEFAVTRRLKRPFEVRVVQQARARRVTRNRLVAHFKKRHGSFKWDGAGATDGYYLVRFAMRLPGGGLDVRRFALRRSRGLFRNLPASYLKTSCGPLRSFKLQRPVFGRSGLKITYSLGTGVDRVSVIALRGKRVLRRFNGAGAQPGKAYRLKLPARGLRRGARVRVRVTVVRAGTRQTSTLVSKRF